MIETFWFVRLGEGEMWKNVVWKWRKCHGEVEEVNKDENPQESAIPGSLLWRQIPVRELEVATTNARRWTADCHMDVSWQFKPQITESKLYSIAHVTLYTDTARYLYSLLFTIRELVTGSSLIHEKQ